MILRRRIAVGVIALVVIGAAAVVVVLVRNGHRNAAARTPAAATATVRRTDLADYQQVDGVLGYAHDYDVRAPAGKGGTLTWLPGAGEEISRGHRAYAVDGHGVPLFYGSTPLWRPLSEGVDDGHDVYEIEHNLAELGYGSGMTVDDDFTAATADAVEAWQDDRGVAVTGSVAPGDVLMEPEALRVTKRTAAPGAAATGPLYSASGTRRVVTVKMPVDQQQLARRGARVRVDLPGGKTVTGRVSDIGTVAQGGGGDDDSGSGADSDVANATIDVDVTLTRASDAGRLDKAPVTVEFAGSERKNVLAVPVTALLARPGGGYVVEAVDAEGHRRSVPVRLGVFAQSEVEVSGPGVVEGMRVEVPSS